MTRNYRDEIVKLIEQEVANAEDSDNITLNFIEGLFPQIVSRLRVVDEAFRMPSLDEDTVKVYFD